MLGGHAPEQRIVMTAQPQQADLDLDAFEQPAPEPSLLPRVASTERPST